MKRLIRANINLRTIVEALLASSLAVAPTGVTFGILAWSNNELWYIMLLIHCLGFISVFIFWFLPEDKQWGLLKGVARYAATDRHGQVIRDYDPESELEELKQKRKTED